MTPALTRDAHYQSLCGVNHGGLQTSGGGIGRRRHWLRWLYGGTTLDAVASPAACCCAVGLRHHSQPRVPSTRCARIRSATTASACGQTHARCRACAGCGSSRWCRRRRRGAWTLGCRDAVARHRPPYARNPRHQHRPPRSACCARNLGAVGWMRRRLLAPLVGRARSCATARGGVQQSGQGPV